MTLLVLLVWAETSKRKRHQKAKKVIILLEPIYLTEGTERAHMAGRLE